MSKTVSILNENSEAKEVTLDVEAVPAGTFFEELRFHKPLCITFNTRFCVSHLITQKQFKNVMGYNPSLVKQEDDPVYGMTWGDAQAFCRKLDSSVARMSITDKFLNLAGMAKPIIRLPSEAELGYAYRYINNPRLFNFGELCEDTWHETDNLDVAPTDGSAWVKDGKNKSLKTVSFIGKPINDPNGVGLIRRVSQHKDACSFQVGFRIAMTF